MSESPIPLPQEETVVIVGVGLIGGSLSAALMQRQLAKTVIGVGRNPQRLQAACDAGLIHDFSTDLKSVVESADLIVFCTPVDQVVQDVRTVCGALQQSGSGSKNLLMTDVGSVKHPICAPLDDVELFVGSHPIAGSHRQGFEAADPDLFANRVCVVTPTQINSEQQVNRVERFWKSVGMSTCRMSPVDHDHSLALTSHLPHVVAASLAATLSPENRPLTGTGFRDTTRIAAGDPDLWTGILMNNADGVVAGIDRVQQQLAEFRRRLVSRDEVGIRKLLDEGQKARAALERSS